MKLKMKQLAAIVSMPCFVGLTYAESTNLSLEELDLLTAGGANEASFSGGSVVAGSSSSSLEEVGNISILDESQNAVEAINLVNSSASVVVNGVNVWDNVGDPSADVVGPSIVQDNDLFQVMNQVASLPSYERTSENVDQSWDVSESYSSSGTQNETLNVNESYTDTSDYSNSEEVTIEAPATIVSTDQTTVDGEALSVVGDLTMSMVTAEGEFTGTGCMSSNGQCTANSDSSNTMQSSGDLQLDGTFDSSYEETGSYTDTGESSQRAPLVITGVMAQYVVLDESELTVSNQYELNLGGTAQSNVAAMNVVNSVGSAVANGVNVGRTTGVSQPSTISQTNFTTQYR